MYSLFDCMVVGNGVFLWVLSVVYFLLGVSFGVIEVEAFVFVLGGRSGRVESGGLFWIVYQFI